MADNSATITEKLAVQDQVVSVSSSLRDSSPHNNAQTQQIDLEQLGEDEGYTLDEAKLKARLGLPADAQLKKSPSGLVLIPQPSDDALDPLNWPRWKKNLIIFMVAVTACSSDYSAATGASALMAQAHEWHATPDTINHATAGNTFMLGIGGLVTVWLSAYFGRLPVFFWFQLFAAATGIWTAAAQSFESYMAGRILNGFFVVSGAAGGLMWINDLFFFHERPRMINLWSTAIILSPFLGPQFMAAILSVASWRVGMWLNFGIITFGLLVTVLVGEETFYPRHKRVDQNQRKSRVMRLLGVEQTRTRYTGNSFFGSGNRLLRVAIKPPVLVICLYYFFDFPWTIGNNTTISVFVLPEYHWGPRNLAALYVAPVIGAICGLIFGHYIFNITGSIWARFHKGRIDPEARLIALWIVLPFKIIGYNLIGTSLEQGWSYWVLAVGWGMHNFSTVVTTSAVAAYLIDAYPEGSGESAAWLNFARTLSGFIVGYIQITWAESQGTMKEYGIQTAIMGGAFVVFILYMQFYGGQLRRKFGRLQFKTN